MLRFLSVLCLVGVLQINADSWTGPKHKALSEELIEYVNTRPGVTWRATHYPRFKTEADVRKMLGTIREPENVKRSRRPTVSHEDVNIDLPKEFNATANWPMCQTIGKIADQSNCGSCWAVAGATAMSDRLCTVLRKPQYQNIQLSARDLLSCCTNCGFGCVGGWTGEAWDYWRDVGLVTGGDFGDTKSCLPYPFAQCGHAHTPGLEPCPSRLFPTPKCVKKCQDKYPVKYEDDIYKAATSYNLAAMEQSIQKEIWLNGPVEAALNVYADFSSYGGGIYRHQTGELLGGHAVRIIGWGEEKGVKYWLIANSWNTYWGEKGLFRIVRGENHCGIEEDVVAGIPLEKQ